VDCDTHPLLPVPVLSEISDLLFVSYFASQSEEIKFGDYIFVLCKLKLFGEMSNTHYML